MVNQAQNSSEANSSATHAPSPITQPIPDKSKTKVLLFGLLSLLLLSGVGMLVLGAKINDSQQKKQAAIFPTATQPSRPPDSDPTADWKTYYSPENTYSFKYPTGKDWKIVSSDDKVSIVCTKCSYDGEINVFEIKPAMYKSIEEYRQVATKQGVFDFLTSNIGNVEALSGITVGEASEEGTYSYWIPQTFALNNGSGYIITRKMIDMINFKSYPAEPSHEIYATLRFIPPPVNTTNWTTFKGANFEIKLPLDWEVRNTFPQESQGNVLFKGRTFSYGIALKSMKYDLFGSIYDTSLTPTELISEFKKQYIKQIIAEKITSINGLSATEIIVRYDTVEEKYLILQHKGKTYMIHGGGAENNSVIYEMLSSIKFNQYDRN